MVNKKQKGQSKELLCRKELEAAGWLVGFKSHTCRQGPFYKANDFFNLFDVVAVKNITEDKFPRWIFVSVTHAGAKSKPEEISKINQFKNAYGTPDMYFELWLWHKSGYRGRGKDKHWEQAKWEKIVV